MGRKHAVIANLASAALQAEDGKPRTQGESGAAHGAAPACAHQPEGAVSRGVERFAEPHVSGRLVIADSPKGIERVKVYEEGRWAFVFSWQIGRADARIPHVETVFVS